MSIAKLIGTFFGAGLLRPGPGTWGSLAALPVSWFILDFYGQAGLLIATALVTIVGWIATQFYMRDMDAKADPQEIVIDEVAGQMLALCILTSTSIVAFAVGFLLFRLFDITKPGPIGWADRKLPGAAGVMTDDLLAGIAAAALLALIIALTPAGILL